MPPADAADCLHKLSDGVCADILKNERVHTVRKGWAEMGVTIPASLPLSVLLSRSFLCAHDIVVLAGSCVFLMRPSLESRGSRLSSE